MYITATKEQVEALVGAASVTVATFAQANGNVTGLALVIAEAWLTVMVSGDYAVADLETLIPGAVEVTTILA